MEPASRVEKTRRWTAARRAEAERLAERAQDERRRHSSVDAIFEMVDRDSEVGGGIIAGALAYRLFIWLLPLALVVVAGLGIAADANSESPEAAAKSLGVEGLVSSSIANAADSPNRWYALLIGVPVLIWVTRSVLRALIAAHRLIWTDDRSRAPKPKLVASLRLLALLLSLRRRVGGRQCDPGLVAGPRPARDADRARVLLGAVAARHAPASTPGDRLDGADPGRAGLRDRRRGAPGR